MASIARDKDTGRRTVQFVAGDNSRKSIRLGKVTAKQAECAKGYIEDLIACNATGSSPKGTTAEWIVSIPSVLRKRLVRVGLIGPRDHDACPALGEWLNSYVDSRKDVKESTSTVYSHAKRNLLAFFDKTKPLNEITCADADAFGIFLKTDEGLADNTVRRRMGIAKQFFRAAVRKKHIAENPFDGQSTLVRENRKRSYFVTQAETEAVLDCCPDAAWRLVFALARYGGLRCPSEIERLKWEDINWERMRFIIHSRKTEHHEKGGIRVAPIFPTLYPYLQDAFEQAKPGTIFCCPQFTNAAQMYRKVIVQAVKRAGLKPWPKLFQNCRASCETELAERFPIQVVCEWIGNSPPVAAKHYLQVTEDHYRKAVQNQVQSTAVPPRTASHAEVGENSNLLAHNTIRKDAATCENTRPHPMGRTGLEPVTSCVSSRRSSQLS